MMRNGNPPRRRLAAGALVMAVTTVIIAAVVSVTASSQLPPSGVQAVAWDREVCTHCRMHIGNPAYAVQLQTTDGRVVNFDDPGCYFAFTAKHRESVHAVYFHHHRNDVWLTSSEVAFAYVDSTPMGYGVGAVLKGTPGSLALAQARANALSDKGGH
jgi:copper chaperone NosL